MRNLLWVGDSVCASGFERNTRYCLDALRRVYRVTALGINFYGDPGHNLPYDIYPASSGGDLFGFARIGPVARFTKADVVVVQGDVWNFPEYLDRLRAEYATYKLEPPPVVGIVAVDGRNCQGHKLNGLSLAVFWTRFAEQEARNGGYTGRSAVVPLGVDRRIYFPMPQRDARAMFQFNEQGPTTKSFIVGNVNRNQQRKRMDLLIEYFADWVLDQQVDDAFLMLHSCPTGDQAFDLPQLAEYYGVRDRLLLVQPPMSSGFPEHLVNATYNVFDVYLSTSQGEGFGLPALEAMAAAVPCLLGDWAAYAEWAKDAALLVPCTTRATNLDGSNVIGGVMDHDITIKMLHRIYKDAALREQLRANSMKCAAQPQHGWAHVGASLIQAIDDAVFPPVIAEGELLDLFRPAESVTQ